MTPKKWDRPPNSQIPNRPGDLTPDNIFCELGRAVSAWEGVQAGIAALFEALGEPQSENISFSDLPNVHKKAARLEQAAIKLLGNFSADHQETVSKARTKLRKTLKRYRGWAERRNDLAHGYVTTAIAPDYTSEEQELVETFSLCPSHSRLKLWGYYEDYSLVEPCFNYTSEDIRSFRVAFEALDTSISVLTKSIKYIDFPTDS